MTTLAIPAGYQPFTRSVNTGSSPEAKSLEERLSKVMLSRLTNRAERARAFHELVAAISVERNSRDANIADEDEIQQLSERFLSALPAATPSPVVGLDPDGEVNFEWFGPNRRVFSVSMGRHGVLSYAGIFSNHEKIHGTELFVDTVPALVLQGIRRAGFAF